MGQNGTKILVCTAPESGVLRVFNLEMDRSRMWLYEASWRDWELAKARGTWRRRRRRRARGLVLQKRRKAVCASQWRVLSPRRYPFFHLYRKNWPDRLSMYFLCYASAEYTPLKGTMWFNCSLPFHFRYNYVGYFYQARANPASGLFLLGDGIFYESIPQFVLMQMEEDVFYTWII